MSDERQSEKTILLMVMAALMVIVIFFLRLVARSEGGRTADMFWLLTIIILGLIAVCVYRFVKM